jgi:hypothetical protein
VQMDQITDSHHFLPSTSTDHINEIWHHLAIINSNPQDQVVGDKNWCSHQSNWTGPTIHHQFEVPWLR